MGCYRQYREKLERIKFEKQSETNSFGLLYFTPNFQIKYLQSERIFGTIER